MNEFITYLSIKVEEAKRKPLLFWLKVAQTIPISPRCVQISMTYAGP